MMEVGYGSPADVDTAMNCLIATEPRIFGMRSCKEEARHDDLQHP